MQLNYRVAQLLHPDLRLKFQNRCRTRNFRLGVFSPFKISGKLKQPACGWGRGGIRSPESDAIIIAAYKLFTQGGMRNGEAQKVLRKITASILSFVMLAATIQ
jgi:hypothetical protein